MIFSCLYFSRESFQRFHSVIATFQMFSAKQIAFTIFSVGPGWREGWEGRGISIYSVASLIWTSVIWIIHLSGHLFGNQSPFLNRKWLTYLEIQLSGQSVWKRRCADKWGSTVAVAGFVSGCPRTQLYWYLVLSWWDKAKRGMRFRQKRSKYEYNKCSFSPQLKHVVVLHLHTHQEIWNSMKTWSIKHELYHYDYVHRSSFIPTNLYLEP